jgi:hypothetical protein
LDKCTDVRIEESRDEHIEDMESMVGAEGVEEKQTKTGEERAGVKWRGRPRALDE